MNREPRQMQSRRAIGACCQGVVRLVVLVSLAAPHAAAQAAAEYGGAIGIAGAHVSAGSTRALKTASEALQQNKPDFVHLPARVAEDLEGTNRKALEERAGKDAAKLMLRSAPTNASVRIDGKPVGRTPLVLTVAPGTYSVEMESPALEQGRQQVDLLPKETREVVLALKTRYPARVQLAWPAR